MATFEDFQRANWLKRANRTAQILLSITLIGGLNYLATRYFLRLDLTPGHVYSLSPETLAYISQIEEPVKIVVTIPPDSEDPDLHLLYRYTRDLLNEYVYAGQSGGEKKIEVEFVDLYKEVRKADSIARSYGIDQPYEMVVASGTRKRSILPTDILEIENNRPRAFLGEQVFTSAIIEVSSKRRERIYFVVGHGEMRVDDVDARRGLSQLAHQLRLRNLDLEELDLTKFEGVPEDADLIVIASPQGPLQTHEVEKLRNFLSARAGRLIILIDPWRHHGLDELFYEWGILSDDMLIVDQGPDYEEANGNLLIRQLAQHPITDLLLKNRIPIVVGQSRPVRRDLGAPFDERLTTVPLIGSSPSSWAETSYRETRRREAMAFNPSVDLKGPVPIASVSERRVSSPFLSIVGGRLVVIGNSQVISNQQINSLGNHMLILNTINWCLDRDKLLTIPPRPIERLQISLTREDSTRIGILLLGLPATIALLGLAVYWIRSR